MTEQLNKNQLKAVTTNAKKVLVMAGAGSGKTKVLTTRISHLLAKGIQPQDICAFTFTNKAAREMKWRLEKILDKESQVTISTFHSYCYNLLLMFDNYQLLGFTKKPEVITNTDKSKIIKQILVTNNIDMASTPFVSAISKIKNNTEITELNDIDRLLLNKIYNKYQQTLLKSSAIDFDDMIPLYIKLLNENEYLKESLQVPYILVDECQDTNQIQYELIKLISSKYQNIFMVGDEDQLIYSFRNSTIKILKKFEETCDEVIILNENYRCNTSILEKANNLISYNPNRLKKDLTSQIIPIQDVKYAEYTTVNEEAYNVVKTINSLVLSGEKLEDIAILFRNNNQVFTIEKELTRKQLPYQLFGGMPFFEYKEIKSIIYTYRLLFNPKNEIAFSNIYNQPIPSLEVYEYQKFITEYHKQTFDIITFSANYAINPKLQKLGFSLLQLQDQMNKLNSEVFFMEILSLLNYNKYLKESNQQKPQYQRIMALKEMIQDINLNEIEEYFNNLILENIDDKKTKGISLLTIHKAKGLEFNVVFVVGCNEGILPGYSKKIEAIEEERRICYVACTRAKQRLYLSSAQIHYINGQIQKLKPSQFLTEAGLNEIDVMKFFGNYFYNK